MKRVLEILVEWGVRNRYYPVNSGSKLLIIKHFSLAPHYWEMVPENGLMIRNRDKMGRYANQWPFQSN